MKKLLIALFCLIAIPALVLATESINEIDVEAGVGNSLPEIYNCQRYVSLDGINPLDIRIGFYAFTGEMIYEGVIVRDANGWIDTNKVTMTIDEEDEALCTDYTEEFISGNWPGGNCTSLNVNPDDAPASGNAMGEMLPGGFDIDTDRFFACIYTVEQQEEGEHELSVKVTDNMDEFISTSIAESWVFNPPIRLTIETTYGDEIEFEDAKAGETAYSTNKLRISNVAEDPYVTSGVNLFVFIAASDLTDPYSSNAKCPYSNVMHVGCPDDVEHTTINDDQSWIEENILEDWQLPTLEFLATSGTLQTGGFPHLSEVVCANSPYCDSVCTCGYDGILKCTDEACITEDICTCETILDGGLKGPTKEWKCVPEYKENYPCGLTQFEQLTPDEFESSESGPGIFGDVQWRCRNGAPLPDTFNILPFGSRIDVAFRLHYPMPCIGEFSNGQIYIIAQAI